MLLRLACGVAILLSVCLRWESLSIPVASAGALTAGLLLAGLATSLAALAGALLVGWATLASGDLAPCPSTISCLAVAVLGPGACSLDALRFGRRVIHVRGADGRGGEG